MLSVVNLFVFLLMMTALVHATQAGRNPAQLVERVGIERDAVREALGPRAPLDLARQQDLAAGVAGGEAVT